MRKITFVLSILVVAVLTGCNNPRAGSTGVWYNPFSWGDQTLEQSLEEGCVGGATETVVDGSTYPCPDGSTTDTPSEPEGGPTTSANCGNPQLQVLYLTVVNPADSPQPQIGHPSAYGETHVSGTPVCVVIDVPSDYVGIVGGFSIDDKTNGVYQAFGPGHHEFVISDGFGLITTGTWAQAEWEFRLQQADTYNWAHTHIDNGPLK